jgi:hypothetical protein
MGDSADARALGAGVAFLAVLGGAVFAPLSVSTSLGPFVAGLGMFLFVIWIGSAVSLITIWFGLGPSRFGIRFAWAVGPCLLGFLVPEVSEAFAVLTLGIVCASLPHFALRPAGYQCRIYSHEREFDAAPPEPSQFTLKQLLVWTVVVSCYAAIARVRGLPRFDVISWRQAKDAGAIVMMFSLISLCCACSILMPLRRSSSALQIGKAMTLGLILFWFTALLIVMENPILVFEEQPLNCAALTLGVMGHVLAVCLVLLAYRGLGYRLTRQRQTS